MGYAIAEEAARRGAKVTLISGPTALKSPRGMRRICVVTADQMRRAVLRSFRRTDALFMVAAVSDWRPTRFSRHKIKKIGPRKQQISLSPTPDILEELGRKKKKGQILIGFAAETKRLIPYARIKLHRKNLDYIVANQVDRKNSGFESDRNRLILLSQGRTIRRYPLLTKKGAARRLVTEIISK